MREKGTYMSSGYTRTLARTAAVVPDTTLFHGDNCLRLMIVQLLIRIKPIGNSRSLVLVRVCHSVQPAVRTQPRSELRFSRSRPELSPGRLELYSLNKHSRLRTVLQHGL